MRKQQRVKGKARDLDDEQLSKVQGGKEVAVIRLHAVVPERVSVVPTEGGGFTIDSNITNARITTQQGNDGTTVNVVGS